MDEFDIESDRLAIGLVTGKIYQIDLWKLLPSFINIKKCLAGWSMMGIWIIK